MSASVHELDVEVYYDDTDFSGVVYHANYLKYMERAREHMLGRAELVRLYQEEGHGFVVYKAALTYKEGAVFGDELIVRSCVTESTPYRIVFSQRVFRKKDDRLMVEGVIHLACVDKEKKLIPLPTSVQGIVSSGIS